MALPAIVNISLYAGDDFSQELAFDDEDGLPINLTGATIAAKWKPSYGSSTSQAFTVVVDDAVNGEVTVSLTDTATATMTNGVWDLQSTSAGGAITTLVGGRVSVYQQVT